MSALYRELEAFKRYLPPSLAVYWIEILVSLIILTILFFFGEKFEQWLPVLRTMLWRPHHYAAIAWCFLRRTAKGRNVCLLGLSDAGKSLLFLQVSFLLEHTSRNNYSISAPKLKFGHFGPTHNSIVENSQQYRPENVKASSAYFVTCITSMLHHLEF